MAGQHKGTGKYGASFWSITLLKDFERENVILKLTFTYYIVEFKTHMNFQDSKMIPGNDVVCV